MFRSLAHLLVGSIDSYLVRWLFPFCSSSCPQDAKPLSEAWLLEIVSLSVSCPVYSVDIVFYRAKAFTFQRPTVRSWGWHCWSSSQKSVVCTYVKCFLVFFFSRFSIPSFELMSLNWLELTLVKDERYRPNFILTHMDTQFFQHCVLKRKLNRSHLRCVCGTGTKKQTHS